jgi:hypothetical protein
LIFAAALQQIRERDARRVDLDQQTHSVRPRVRSLRLGDIEELQRVRPGKLLDDYGLHRHRRPNLNLHRARGRA